MPGSVVVPVWVPWLAGAAALAGLVVWSLRRRATGPRRGEIWWADVPYTDGSGSKVRPCLVLVRHWRGIVVLKITSQDKSRRRDHITIPTRSWDPHAQHDSYLNLGEPIVVRSRAFRRRAGACDPAVLSRIGQHRGLTTRGLLSRAVHRPRAAGTPDRSGHGRAPA
jgi:mRNA-degrading endonuclease toxin of MazEF toxin-antitoxin module